MLRGIPGALGPLLAWSSRNGLELAQTTRRIKGMALYDRDLFLAVARCTVERLRLPASESAWPTH